MKKAVSRGISGLMALLMMAVPFSTGTIAAETSQSSDKKESTISYQSVLSYSDYLEKYQNMPKAADTITLRSENIRKQSADVTLSDQLDGKSGVVQTGETSSVTYGFTVPAAGMYQTTVEYYPTRGKGSTIVRSFLVDNACPYEEMREIDFPRRWKDEAAVTQDSNGNDVRPPQVEAPGWMSNTLTDSMGYYTTPLQLYLSAGEHTITIESVKEPMAVGSITLSAVKEIPSYAEKKEQYAQDGLKDAQGYYKEIEGEKATYKSDSSIYPIYDRSSPETSPNSAVHIRLNTIGGAKWEVSGRWLEWDVDDVPEDGLYVLGVKGRQNILNGAYSCRKLYVNGEVPFKEAETFLFYYDTGWKMVTLADKQGTALRIPLKKGKNTIRMEATLGNLSGLIMKVNQCVSALNNIYMNVLMITGPKPDKNRDYQFQDQIPTDLKELKRQGDLLNAYYEEYVKLTGQNGQQAQTLKKISRQTLEMQKKPSTIASRFSTFSSNITELGNWLNTVAEQPLEVDYLVVASPEKALPTVKNSFGKNLWFNIEQLFASFVQDYDTTTLSTGDGKKVKIWVGNGATGGRDQAQVLQRMTTNNFNKQNGIQAEVQLVSMGALLPATMSGKGPDVALTLNASDPINYAVRHGVVDLSKLEGFDEVKNRFMKSGMEPFTFNGGVYALPETQTFYMMFYRKDILSELGISVPNTWQDVVNLLPVLQKKNLNFGLPSVIADGAVGIGFPAYCMFLYQHGGEIYSPNGATALIDSQAGVNAFCQWTKFYTDYSLPTQYDFMNRFRSGAVPIGIQDYSLYNTLQVFAPEIKGRWDFCAVPGTPQKDGSINRCSCGTTTGCVILSTSKDVESSWKFIKWWTSADVQGAFGLELESILGAAGRYSPANVDALYQIPWSKSQYDAISEQWKHVRGVPEVPGSYMTSRFVDFSFRDTVNSGMDPDESVRDATKKINEEIATRRKEFGLLDK